MRCLFVFASTFVLCIASPGMQAAELDAIRPDQPYRAVRLDPVHYDVDFSVVVTAPYHCKLLKVWLPLPQSDVAKEITDSRLTTFPLAAKPQIGTESTYGNKFAYFELANPQGGQVIRHRFKARVWELHWDLNPAEVSPVSDWPASFYPYLRPQSI